ncbi:MAG: 4Fe-4S dicluster domain-containing protein [Gemmatimonadetes bacterium]|nr:4Fe-4S dicluster domain-containing protein [Gemmatimonadota bacterium]
MSAGTSPGPAAPVHGRARAACAHPGTPLAAELPGLDACVHCGFCLPACPTYLALEDENDSPRGRLVLMRALADGAVALDDAAVGTHLDRCLGCRGCETACPSGVPYGRLLEATRATMAGARPRPLVARAMLAVFARPSVLALAMAVARAWRGTGLPSVLARLPGRIGLAHAMLASTAPVSLRPRGGAASAVAAGPATGGLPTGAAPRREPVALLEGCVMHGLLGHVNRATSRVLAHNGHVIVAAPAQRCCGALHAHAGDREQARALARSNIAAFEACGAALVAVNSAGCGAMMKEYGHLLADDPAWRDRATALAARVRDVSELLAAAGPRGGAPVAVRVAVDHPCHLQHAQRVVREPAAVLTAIPALEATPLPDADQCCGSAGIFNLLEPGVALAVLAPKLAQVEAAGAPLVATGNPGCLLHIGGGLARRGAAVRAVHPVMLLDESYREQYSPSGGGPS